MSYVEDQIYSFVYRGLLARQAVARQTTSPDDVDIAKRLPFALIDETHLEPAQKMSLVYTAIAGFERAVRSFIHSRLLEEVGEDWWTECVPEKRRIKAEKRRDEENKIRWHARRGENPIEYTDIEDLAAIITTNQKLFADFIPDIEWAKHIFKSVEHSRNMIMHSGMLEAEDIERLGIAMKDWLNQVGG